MARFIFKLDTVLKHRRSVEKEKLREFSLAQAKVVAIEEELRQHQRSMDEATEDLRKNRLVGVLDVSFVMAHRRFMMGMQRKGMDLARQIALARQQAEAARLVLTEAAKQRMVMEKLRETQETRWREEQARQETMQLDEVGTQIGFENLKSG